MKQEGKTAGCRERSIKIRFLQCVGTCITVSLKQVGIIMGQHTWKLG